MPNVIAINAAARKSIVAARATSQHVLTQERGNERLAGMLVCRWIAVAFLASQLLFAHGCHGDEDHEADQRRDELSCCHRRCRNGILGAIA